MPDLVLSLAVEQDLLEIARYTSRRWGAEQADRYLTSLERRFEDIRVSAARERTPLPHRPEYRAVRCDHHVIFFTRREDRVIILAVLHARMDLIARLEERLDTDG